MRKMLELRTATDVVAKRPMRAITFIQFLTDYWSRVASTCLLAGSVRSPHPGDDCINRRSDWIAGLSSVCSVFCMGLWAIVAAACICRIGSQAVDARRYLFPVLPKSKMNWGAAPVVLRRLWDLSMDQPQFLSIKRSSGVNEWISCYADYVSLTTSNPVTRTARGGLPAGYHSKAS